MTGDEMLDNFVIGSQVLRGDAVAAPREGDELGAGDILGEKHGVAWRDQGILGAGNDQDRNSDLRQVIRHVEREEFAVEPAVTLGGLRGHDLYRPAVAQ